MSDDLGVEQVEDLEDEAGPGREAIADFAVPQRGRLRLDAGVFDQRTRTEVAQRGCCRRAARDGSTVSAAGDHAVEGARDVVTGRIVVGESRARERRRRRRRSATARSASSWSTPRPTRRLGRPASVVPASPTNSSSESSPRYHSESVDCSPRTRTVRRPNSAPFARTSGVTGSAGSPRGGIDRRSPRRARRCCESPCRR